MSASESRSAVVMALAEEFLKRYRQGQRPSLKEYIERHPELAAEIKDVFPAMALMENVALADESLAEEVSGPAPATAAVPQQLGDYRLLREVGRGGMGIVYEAEQVSLGRHVALKLLPRKLFVDAQQRRRFEREAKSAAKLHHTNIVPVFGVGEHGGMPYYVMQFIQGLGLDQVLKELRRLQNTDTPVKAGEDDGRYGTQAEVLAADVACSLMAGGFAVSDHSAQASEPHQQTPPPSQSQESSSDTTKLSDSSPLSSSLNLPGRSANGKQASYWHSVASIGVQVAQALEYAHKQGILHRDIKPSNLLLDTRGTVWVTDFGLARAENEDHLTQTGDIVGTLRYMPPEAFEGRSEKRSDIYSLGLTLYELLALQPAFGEKDRRQLIKRVTTEEPLQLRKLTLSIPRDLATIVQKAIDREPSQRYTTAGELAADLQRFLDDEPVRARQVTNVERLLRWGKRNKAFAALSAVALLLLLAVAVVSMLSALWLLDEKRRASKAEHETVTASVKSLMNASPDSVPFLVDTLRLRREEVLPSLEEREAQVQHELVPRLRLNVALAVLGRDRCRELCVATPDTPPAESSNLLLGLQSGDGEAARAELWRLYEQAKDGEGRTRLAIALLEMCDPRAAQRELALKQDLTTRIRFIHRFASWHGDLSAIPDLLLNVEDGPFRSGLCLAVASMDASRLPASTVHSLDELLTQLYSTARDGGTHGAAEYALSRRGLPLPSIAPTRGPIEGRRWFTNRLGMTLVAVEPGWFYPQNFSRPPGPAGLPVQTILVTRPFFIGDQEVTAEWYRRFLQSTDHPQGEELTDEDRRVILNEGLARVRWRSAVLFCNWLSRAEGRTPCYRPTGPELGLNCDFAANGYRLPTDAEWEHVFRCGTTTRFLVGDDAARMLEYGRVFGIEPGAGKCYLPNPRGLFDMLGNGWEMCWDQGIEQFGSGLSINPIGPVGTQYAMRGGAAEAGLHYLHGSARIQNSIHVPEAFRVVCGPLHPEDAKSDRVIALSAANRLLERYPKSSPQFWLHCGHLYAELEQYDEAVEACVEVLESKPVLLLSLGNDFACWDKVFPALVKTRPRDTWLWLFHLNWLARRCRWQEAATASVRLTELIPNNPVSWHLDAALHLQKGDIDGYRRDCRQMVQHFGASSDPFAADRTAKTCLLLPDAATDFNLLSKLANRAVAGIEQHPTVERWFRICKALADYRTGHYDAALESIQKVTPTPQGNVLDATAYLLLALCEHRRGRSVEADQALKQALALREHNWAQPHLNKFFDGSWDDWLRFDVLRREAQTLIEGRKAEEKK